MSSTSYRQLTLNGLWKNNPALVQLLGLCPLLAVTASTVNALGLAAATLFVLVVSNTSVSLIRLVVSDTIRLKIAAQCRLTTETTDVSRCVVIGCQAF